ncbi:hypothetical protein MXD58_012560, partial [Frankia sp. AgKG'84/4]|nr:hypothetical protein [Frankia sp. AgKG'84/4]
MTLVDAAVIVAGLAATLSCGWAGRRLDRARGRWLVWLSLALSSWTVAQVAGVLHRWERASAGRRTIAEVGYSGAGADSRRFFPLLPLMVRVLDHIPGADGHAGIMLLLVVNVAALGFALVLVRLARLEGLDEAATYRLIWLAALAPPAFVLVMGYAEAFAGLLAVAVLLGARSRRWELAACAGLLSGLCRPLGVLLAVPVAVEAARGLPWPLLR